MNISKIDTSKFLYDPTDERSFMGLRKFKEFKAGIRGLPREKVFQYIIWVYDPASKEIEQEYPLLPQRKMKVANMVQLTMKNNHVPLAVEDMLIGKNDQVNAMIVKYLHLFNDPNLLMLVAYKAIFSALNKAAIGGEYSKSLITSIKDVNGVIEKLTESILKGKDETQLREDLYRSIEGRKLGIRAEEIAEKLQRGEEPFPGVNPYGRYEVKPLKFTGDK